jgi:hypothetical protein
MYLSESLWRLESRGESWILEAEERYIDALVDGIFFLTLDASRGCDHSSILVERDEYGIFSGLIDESIGWDIRSSDDAFFSDIDFESFTNERVHE